MATALHPAPSRTDVLTVELVDDTAVVRVVGDLDDQRIDAAKRVLGRVRDCPPIRLQIDATESALVDTAGLAALAATALVVRQRGGTVSMIASPPVQRVIERCGVGAHFGLLTA